MKKIINQLEGVYIRYFLSTKKLIQLNELRNSIRDESYELEEEEVELIDLYLNAQSYRKLNRHVKFAVSNYEEVMKIIKDGHKKEASKNRG